MKKYVFHKEMSTELQRIQKKQNNRKKKKEITARQRTVFKCHVFNYLEQPKTLGQPKKKCFCNVIKSNE